MARATRVRSENNIMCSPTGVLADASNYYLSYRAPHFASLRRILRTSRINFCTALM